MERTTSLNLRGVRILVVEDRAPVAMALCDRLQDCGATIIGPGATLGQATQLADGNRLDLALLDVDLGGEFSFPLARSLRARGVPIILMTGYDCSTVPQDLRDLPFFEKLGSMAELSALAARALPDGAAG